MRTALGWEAWEAEVNKDLNLSATIASGSQAHDPGDGVDRRHPSERDYALQADAKFTTRGSFSVNRRFMRESWERAATAGQSFVLPLRFADTDKGVGQTEDWVVLTYNDFKGLLMAQRELERAQRER